METLPPYPPASIPLRDDDVGLVVGGGLRLLHGRDLLHDQAARVVDLLHQVSRVIEREGDDGGRHFEGDRERRGINVGHYVIDGERPIGRVSKLADVAAKLIDRSLPRSQTAQPARVRAAAARLGEVNTLIPA